MGKDCHWNIQLTVSSWGLGSRNYKFSGKCRTGRLKAQTLEAFTRDCIQFSKFPANKLRCHSRVKSQTRLPFTGLKDSDSEKKK
jgi:hypothetical protein